jgi:hypothetical protein
MWKVFLAPALRNNQNNKLIIDKIWSLGISFLTPNLHYYKSTTMIYKNNVQNFACVTIFFFFFFFFDEMVNFCTC